MTRRPAGSPAGDTAEAGFTLVELLVASTVFVVFLVAAAVGLEGSLTATAANRGRVVAAGLLSQTLDQVQAMPFSAVPSLGSTATARVIGPTTYTVAIRTAVVSPPGGATGSCTFNAAGTDGENVVVDVSVTWPGMAAAPVTGQVEMTPPAKTIAAGYANLTVQVVGGSGAPIVGAVLTLSPVSGTATTDANGCASFTGLAPGQAYTVSASPSANLIDQSQSHQGVASGQPTVATWTSASLASGSYNFQQVTWDHPATVSATDNAPAGYAAPNTNLCYFGNFSGTCQPWTNGLGPDIQATTAVGGAGNDTLRNLGTVTAVQVFPFTSWRAWTGDCADADPLLGGSTVVATPAGGSASVNAPLIRLSVTSHLTSSIPASAGATYGYLVAYHSADSVCTLGEALGTYITANSKGPFLVAMPAGTWYFYYFNPAAPTTIQPGVTVVVQPAANPIPVVLP